MTYAPTVLGAPAYGAVPMVASPYGGFAYGGARRIVAQPRYTLGSYAQKGYEARHVTDEKLNNLKEVRAACGTFRSRRASPPSRPSPRTGSSTRSCSTRLT